MTMSAISTANQSVSQMLQTSGMDTSSNRHACRQSDADVRPPALPGGGLVDAILSALSEIGGATSSADADSTSSSGSSLADAAEALKSFMHELFDALHAQSSRSTDGDDAGQVSSDNGDGAVAAFRGRKPDIDADLQKLIDSLSSSTDATRDADSSGLQQSFDKLVAVLGGGPDADLSAFLRALSDKLPDAPAVGAVIDAHA